MNNNYSFFKKSFYWSIVDLQCINFWCTSKWFSYIYLCMCMHAKSFQSCPTLCDPMDYSQPGSSLQGTLSGLFYTGKNTGVSCHGLLQVIFLTWRSNSCLVSPSLAGGFFTTSTTWKAYVYVCVYIYILFHLFSIMIYYRILDIFYCAIQ